MDLVNFIMLMVVIMKVNGNMEEWRGKEHYFIQTVVKLMLDNGRMINLMEKALFLMKVHRILKVLLIILILIN